MTMSKLLVSPQEVVLSLELLFAHGDIWFSFIFYLLPEDGESFLLSVYSNSAKTTRATGLLLSSFS